MYATFATDPKVIGLSDHAFRRYIEALCYSGLHETDGRIPRELIGRAAKPLRDAGLLESADAGTYLIHGWANRQLLRSDLERQREVTRNRVRNYRARNAVSNGQVTPTEVEVEREVEVDIETTKSKTRAAVPENRPDDDQSYLAEKLGQAYDQELSFAALQKLNNRYTRLIVTDALRYVRGFPPSIPPRSLYAYVEAIAKDKAQL